MNDHSPTKLRIPAVIHGLEGYPGCKGGAGVYQQIRSHLPKCKTLYVPFLGHCAITRNIKLPETLILNDMNLEVIHRWRRNYKDRERIKLKVARHTKKLMGLPIQERNAILDSLNQLKLIPAST